MRTACTPRRHCQRGQALLIFGLSAMVLFAIIGLAVDAGVSYAESALEERAAAAAALSGVTFMPTFTGSAPNDATSKAVATAALNGFSTAGANLQHVKVTPSQVPANCVAPNCLRNRLQVTIDIDVPTTFLRLIGFGSHRVERSAVAEYLRPITLGQPGPQAGSDLGGLGHNGNYYFMRTEGWGTDRGQGDPFTPNPADSTPPGNPGGVLGNASITIPPDTHALSGVNLNESNVAVPGLSQRGGYNYQIYIPPGVNGEIQVYNPVFAPDPGCPNVCSVVNGVNYSYHENDSFTAVGSNNASDYSLMKYTLYSVPNVFGHTSDVPISTFKVWPIDAQITLNKWRDVRSFSTVPPPALKSPMPDVYHGWINVGSADAADAANGLTSLTTYNARTLDGGVNGSYYRLRVDTLDSSGNDPSITHSNSFAHKGYAVRAVDPITHVLCSTCSVSALNDMAIFTPVQSSAFNVPIVQIPPEYAGRTLNVDIYDPGDVGCPAAPALCSNLLGILDNTYTLATGAESGGVFKLTSSDNDPCTPLQIIAPGSALEVQTESRTAPTYSGCNNTPPASNPNTYNATWLRYAINVPTTYNPGPVPASWYWYLRYNTNVTATDTVTVTLSFNGAPVHLVNG